MKVYISADIEGATGVTAYKQVVAGRAEFSKACLSWIEDLNKLAEGAFAAGAEQVLINDAHASMDNLIADKIHPKVEYISGYLKPLNQMEGLDQTFKLVFLFTHARAGLMGVLSHSYVLPDVYLIKLNGQAIGELGLNSLLAAYYGVPVGLVIGDDATAREAQDFIPGVETVITKNCIDQFTARCYTPEVTGRLLQEQAFQVVKRYQEFKPLIIDQEFNLEITFTMPAMASLVSYVPGVQKVDARTVSFLHHDFLQVLQFRIVATNLAKSIGDQLRDGKK